MANPWSSGMTAHVGCRTGRAMRLWSAIALVATVTVGLTGVATASAQSTPSLPAASVAILPPEPVERGDYTELTVEVVWPGLTGELIAWISRTAAACPALPQDALAQPGEYVIGLVEPTYLPAGFSPYHFETSRSADGLNTGEVEAGERGPYLICAWSFSARDARGVPDPSSVRAAQASYPFAAPLPPPIQSRACPGGKWRWSHLTTNAYPEVSESAIYFAGLEMAIGTWCASGRARERYPYRICVRNPRGKTRCWSKATPQRDTRYVYFTTVAGLRGTYTVTWRKGVRGTKFMTRRFYTFAGE